MNADTSPPVPLLVVLGLVGFLVTTAITTASAERRQSEPRRRQLIDVIDDRRHQVDELDAAVAELRLAVAEAEAGFSARTRSDAETEALRRELAMAAGTLGVRGPGIVAELDDSSRRPDPTEDAGAFRIHDRDLQLVVNALFAAGAEAVSVDGNRIVATSPIRNAGETIVVNFRPLGPPYEIRAVGADRRAFEQSAIVQQFDRWKEQFGLRLAIDERDDVEIPGFTGRVAVRAARPEGH